MAEVDIRIGFGTMDAVTFPAAFVGFSKEQVFFSGGSRVSQNRL